MTAFELLVHIILLFDVCCTKLLTLTLKSVDEALTIENC